jgi:hypothetical protein
MPLHDLLEWIEAKPFSPFRLNLTDGRKVDITNPNQIWPGRQSAMIGIQSPEDQRIYERHFTISLLHVISIDPIESANIPTHN